MRTIDVGCMCVEEKNIVALLSCRASGDPKFIWGPQGRNTLGVGMTLGLRLFLVPHLLPGSYYSFGAVRRSPFHHNLIRDVVWTSRDALPPYCDTV